MKETKDSSVGNTILVLDEPNDINEILFRSVFPNLIIFTKSESKEDFESIQDWQSNLVILATKDKELATQILNLYEKGKFDILPFILPDIEPSSIESKTTANLVLFRFCFKRCAKSLRIITNFIVRNSLSQIDRTDEFNEKTIKLICKHPSNFYTFACAIENESEELLFDFLNSIKNLETENRIDIIDASIDLINESNSNEDFIKLFSKSTKLFFKEGNSALFSSEIIKLVDSVLRVLKNKVFLLNGVNYNLTIFLTYFDRFDTLKTRKFLNDISHSSNTVSNKIFSHTLNNIFNTEGCAVKLDDLDESKLSKQESSLLESSAKISTFLNSKRELSLFEKHELVDAYNEYSKFLINGKKDRDKTSLVKKYILTDDS